MKKILLLVTLFTVNSALCAKKFHTNVGATGSTDLKRFDDERKRGLLTGSASTTYLAHRFWSTSLSASYVKELTDYREQYMGNANFSVSRNRISFGKGFSFGSSVSFLLPFNKDQRKMTSMRTQVSMRNSVSYSFAALEKKWLRGISVSYSMGLSKGVHRYKQDAYSNANTSYSLSNTGAFSYSPLGWLALSAYVSSVTRWDYNNTRKDDVYSIGQSLTVTPHKKMSVTIGHELGGRTFDYDGQTYDVDIFDADDASVYLAVSYSI